MLDKLLEENDFKHTICDKMDSRHIWLNHFETNTNSMKEGNDIAGIFRLYTDGSKIQGLAGYGAILLDQDYDILDSERRTWVSCYSLPS